MRTVTLSDHPGELLKQARRRQRQEREQAQLVREAELAQRRARATLARQRRDQAWAERRWWAWLRGVTVVWRIRLQSPTSPRAPATAGHETDILAAGVRGEDLVAARLGGSLGDDWVLLRGYRNGRGEIDQLLLGPRGLVAIEVKHRNATVYCDGDRWGFVKYDRYGNAVERGLIADRRGRSPSEQLNQPAGQLEEFLRSRGHPAPVRRVVLLTHPRSRLGRCVNPTVEVATSADFVITMLKALPAAISARERTVLEELIIRDHHHERRRRPRE